MSSGAPIEQSLEELRSAEAALSRLAATGDDVFVAAVKKVRQKIEERLQKPANEPRIEKVPAKIYVPPEKIDGLFRYLSTIHLSEFFQDDAQAEGRTIEIEHHNTPFSKLSTQAWQLLENWLRRDKSSENIITRQNRNRNYFFIDVRSGVFDIEKLKRALNCSFLNISIVSNKLSNKSAFAPTKPRTTPKPSETGSLWQSAQFFFKWIEEEMKKSHPNVTLICEETYNSKTSQGFFPITSRIVQDLGIGRTSHELRREHMPLVVAGILQRAKVKEEQQTVLSQYMEDFPFDTIIETELRTAAIDKAITSPQKTRILNRLHSANTFLSASLIQSVVEEFIREGFPFDSEKDITLELLECDFQEEYADHNSEYYKNIITEIRNHLRDHKVIFPCSEKEMRTHIVPILNEKKKLKTEGLPLDSLEMLKRYCELLELVHAEDSERILMQIQKRAQLSREKVTPKRLNELVIEIFSQMPEYVKLLGGRGGKMGGRTGRVVRNAGGYGG